MCSLLLWLLTAKIRIEIKETNNNENADIRRRTSEEAWKYTFLLSVRNMRAVRVVALYIVFCCRWRCVIVGVAANWHMNPGTQATKTTTTAGWWWWWWWWWQLKSLTLAFELVWSTQNLRSFACINFSHNLCLYYAIVYHLINSISIYNSGCMYDVLSPLRTAALGDGARKW